MVVTHPALSSDITQTMVDSARVGLDYIVENSDYIEKLALALESKNFSVRKQVFELLSALCVYSADGYSRTLEALEYFKKIKNERYRFKFVVTELQEGPTLDYQTAVIAFINCLILATSELQERIRIRSEFLGLKFAQILNDLRYRKKDSSDLGVQIDVFDEQRESDESQLSNSLPNNIDLSSPLEVFDAILRQITNTPQEIPFLSILQHLLRIDAKEEISDIIWDTAERLVHRATLIESKEDGKRLLSQWNKSSIKSKGDRCACACHKGGGDNRRVGEGDQGLSTLSSSGQGGPPPPPPPPPPPMSSSSTFAPPPPPPPAPPTPPLLNGRVSSSNKPPSPPLPPEELPKLPQQTIPVPKAKMRTVNWNKIPMGQIMNSDKENLWINFAKNYKHSTAALDWDALEGMFCIPSDNKGWGGTGSPNSLSSNAYGTRSPSSTSSSSLMKKESNEILLLDAKRSLNINIFLKQFRSTNKDIINHIMDGNAEGIGAERLRGLLKILPSKDEIEMLRTVPPSDKKKLGSAERFLLELIEVKAYRLRIEAMLLREDLDSCFHNLDASINVILQAAQEIKNARHFQDVVFMILVAGNFLNAGGYAGDAVGVKLSSLQKIADIRGNQPGISLLNFISMEAEAKNPELLNFAKDMVSLEESSKVSIDQIKSELLSLKKKVELICDQLEKPETPSDLRNQLSSGFQEAKLQLQYLQDHVGEVEDARMDLALFFCEDLQTFKLEDCFKILHSFVVRWNQAAIENKKRKQQEEEAKQRKKIREGQFQKRLQLGWETPQSVENFNNANKMGLGLNPEDEIFIACSPRVVRRRLVPTNSTGTSDGGGSSGGNTPDQLIPPSPECMNAKSSSHLTVGTGQYYAGHDITPNGSLRRRRSRVPSDEDETGLMDYLRASGQDGSRERMRGSEQYGSLDRSWSRKTRRRPNLMDFVNDDRERPISPAAPLLPEPQGHGETSGRMEIKGDNPTREWRERISAWFVDLENGKSGDLPRRPPPRRFQRRLNLDSVDPSARGLATLPESESGQEEGSGSVLPTSIGSGAATTYQRVYPDRRPSVTLNTDIVGAMEAIEGAQSPTKERPSSKKLFERSVSQDSGSKGRRGAEGHKEDDINTSRRRSLIGSLATADRGRDEKLVLYLKDHPPSTPTLNKTKPSFLSSSSSSKLKRSPSMPPESIRRHNSNRQPLSTTTNSQPSSSSSSTPTEGTSSSSFDRFSSFRKSRRYKEPPPPSSGLTRSASLYSNVRPRLKTEETTSSSIKPLMKVSIREQQQRGKGSDSRINNATTTNNGSSSTSDYLRSTRVHSPTSMISSNGCGTSVIQIKSPSSSNPPTKLYSKTYLSTSPGAGSVNAERDEGFEESHSSLSETNSQSESHNFPAKERERKQGISTSLSRLGSLRIKKTSNPSHADMISHLNNINNTLSSSSKNKKDKDSSSRSSLQSSRSSLSSQATVVNVKEGNNNKPMKNHNNHNGTTTTTSTPSSRLNLNLSNGSSSSPSKSSGNSNNSKGLTPRILSFMRPTASSTAKDKEPKGSSKDLSSKGSKSSLLRTKSFR